MTGTRRQADPERFWSPALWNQCGTARVETIDLRDIRRPVTEWATDIYYPTNNPSQE